MLPNNPILVIIGATGTQGSSVINHFLQNAPHFKLRGITRNTTSDKSQALSQRGIEMVQADLNEISTLRRVFEGASVIFANTDSDGLAYSKEAQKMLEAGEVTTLPEAAGVLELQQGRNIADAAAEVPGLERLVWSSLANPGAGWDIAEMEAKSNILKYMLGHPGLGKEKVSAVMFAMFVDSLVRLHEIVGWKKNDAGDGYVLRLPIYGKSKFPWIDMAGDAGSYVEALVKAPGGTRVQAFAEEWDFDEVAEMIGRHLGKKVVFESISTQEYIGDDKTGTWEGIAQLFQWVEKFGVHPESEEVLMPEELAQMGHPVKCSSIEVAIQRLNWESIL